MAENEEASQACLFLICYCRLSNLFHMSGPRFRSLETTGTGWKAQEKTEDFPARNTASMKASAFPRTDRFLVVLSDLVFCVNV